jgi:hypothetical protein
MVNDDLMVRVLARIERDPSTWKQNVWGATTECGTTYCFAGHTAVELGVTINWWRAWNGSGAAESVVCNGVTTPFGPFAAEQLGLTNAQADKLFFATPTDIDLLYARCAKIMGIDEQVLRDKVREEI